MGEFEFDWFPTQLASRRTKGLNFSRSRRTVSVQFSGDWSWLESSQLEMSRGMNTELMRRLWIKLNCWPETVSLHKKEKEASTHFMSILLFTIISMSENERRPNAKSVMSGLSHFYRPAPLSADQLLRKTRPIVEIKQWQCIVCVCVWPNSDQCWKQTTLLWCTERFQGEMCPLIQLCN